MIHMGNVGLRLLLKLIFPLKGGWPLAERSAGVPPQNRFYSSEFPDHSENSLMARSGRYRKPLNSR